jgi:hypothetical protein
MSIEEFFDKLSHQIENLSNKNTTLEKRAFLFINSAFWKVSSRYYQTLKHKKEQTTIQRKLLVIYEAMIIPFTYIS